ncbi:MAG: hypothetical protein IJH49_00065 [Aeriscardovia sp.]|nr:hypothetical protein [Aeriscardovia sp.]
MVDLPELGHNGTLPFAKNVLFQYIRGYRAATCFFTTLPSILASPSVLGIGEAPREPVDEPWASGTPASFVQHVTLNGMDGRAVSALRMDLAESPPGITIHRRLPDATGIIGVDVRESYYSPVLVDHSRLFSDQRREVCSAASSPSAGQ